MPRVRVRKTDRGLIQPDIYERAFLDISVRNISLRAAAKSHGICHVTLLRYCRRRAEASREKTRPPGYRLHSKVFSVDQERKLQAYIKRAADIYLGLSPKEVRKFAYELASRYGCKYPDVWDATKMAGKDWLTSFLERNNTLSIRRPQATSMSRSTSFNKTNVTAFYNNLQTVLARYLFEAKGIWNLIGSQCRDCNIGII
uniref:HTH CENPB-type domain-containing protein n=1 Tax=Sinocyclocheilus rhinocerous TaxID=307959 RepID=A0A673H084_9TELE